MVDKPLKQYQVVGAKTLASKKRYILGDEMGIGKTAQALEACRLIKARRILIICPAFLVTNWIAEVQDRYPGLSDVCWAFQPDHLIPKDFKQGVVVISYDKANNASVRAELRRANFDVMVLDEAHYLKNPSSKRTKAIYGARGLQKDIERIWALSGTIMPNYPHELWVHTFVCGVHKLTYREWMKKFCLYDPQWFRVLGIRKEAVPELKNLLSQCMLRRTKKMVNLELPPLIHNVVPLDIKDVPDFGSVAFGTGVDEDKYKTDVQMQEELITNTLNQYMAENKIDDLMDALKSLQVSASALRRFIGLCKAPIVSKIIDDELNDKAYGKVVMFAWFKDTVRALEEGLKDHKPLVITGDTSMDKRNTIVQTFQNNKDAKVLIANIAAAGVGLTLTASNQVIAVENAWSPGVMAQAYMRCHRIGQTEAVTVREFVMKDSVDERVARIIKAKSDALLQIFD